jgi:predicted O-linked N-acetylglucosamine transferase (SPINDLY family)
MLFRERQFDDAAHLLSEALSIEPALRGVHVCVGLALSRLGQLSRAIPHLKAAFAEDDADIELANGYAVVLAAAGELEGALSVLRQVLGRRPDSAAVHSNLLLLMHYSAECTPEDLYAEHLRWAATHAAVTRRKLSATGSIDPGRILRIGLVTPHVVAGPVPAVLLPLLEHSDRRRLEFVMYANSARKDFITARLRAATTAWRRIDGVADDTFAATVRTDRIDIMFDLAGHSGGNRLLAFARRLAPIQVTWLDYFDTTGLDAIDYLLGDPVHTPEASRQRFVERIVRMPVTRLCFLPPTDAPPVAPAPALRRGYLTFGSFNRWAKTTSPVIAFWARLLEAIPDAHLVVKAREFPDMRTAANARLTAHGIRDNRFELRGPSPYLAMLDEYADIDLALDTFPHNGGATTMDALWMGVPVLAHAGDTMIARQSIAMLMACGLDAFTAHSPDGLLAVAHRWDSDRAALAVMRAGMRARVQASPLCDGPRFARDFEAAMRDVWRAWCASVRGRLG